MAATWWHPKVTTFPLCDYSYPSCDIYVRVLNKGVFDEITQKTNSMRCSFVHFVRSTLVEFDRKVDHTTFGELLKLVIYCAVGVYRYNTELLRLYHNVTAIQYDLEGCMWYWVSGQACKAIYGYITR